MTFLEEVRRKVEKEEKACATCGNLVRIGGTLIGCVAHDKLILPNYPPYFGQKPCPECGQPIERKQSHDRKKA